jgi:hypothetical protein
MIANSGSRKAIHMAKRAIDLVIRFMSEQKTLEQVRTCDSFLPPSSAASFLCLFPEVLQARQDR